MAQRKTTSKAKSKADPTDRARDRNRKAQDELDTVLAALAHPTRRQILMNLRIRGESMSSGDIAARYSCSWPTVTRHLGVLKSAGLILVERRGKSLHYRLNKDVLARVWGNWFAHFGVEAEP
jgi:DNA-binding transcriptional ArsR family regulator